MPTDRSVTPSSSGWRAGAAARTKAVPEIPCKEMRTVAIHAPHTQDPPAHALAKGERDAASEGRHMNYETGPLPSKTGYSTVTGSSARAPPTAKGRHPVFGDCVRARGLPAVGDAVSARGVPVVSVTDTTVNTLECLVLATGRRACLHLHTHTQITHEPAKRPNATILCFTTAPGVWGFRLLRETVANGLHEAWGSPYRNSSKCDHAHYG